MLNVRDSASVVSNPVWLAERSRVRAFLRARFGEASSCQDVVDTAEHLSAAIWEFNVRLMGAGGARAIFIRAQSLAVSDQPVLQKVSAEQNGPRFAELRLFVEAIECDTAELVRALITLTEGMFLTLAELTGDLLISPLLDHLKGSHVPEASA